jgi:CheY-like chemotaxis protein
VNLCTNAYQAMRSGGILMISLNEIRIDGLQPAASKSLPPGRYVRLSVTDTGHGMDHATLSRIFEPYFTTKAKGKGTGLGLSMVHGIVTACGGEIRVDSRPGEGTTFQVYLPVIVPAEDGKKKNSSAELVGGTERILLVDDEAPIVQLEKRLLERLGYTVMTKMNSLDALEAFRGDPDAFDLVITDLTMPNLTGLALAEKLVTLRPDIPVIMLTGFSEHLKGKKIRAAGIRRIILKPALTKDLSEAIRQVLDGDDTVQTDSDVPDSMAEARYSMA